MTENSNPIYRSKLERQQAVQQHIFQAPSHDGHKRGRDEDDGVVGANKKQLLQREQKDAIKEHLRCYQQPSKRPVVKKLRFSWDNNEDTTRLYDPSCPLFCLRLRANANNKDDMDKPPKNQNQNQNEKNRHWSDKNIDDMTDRDWHIFMEDVKISYKCKCKARSRIPRPQPLRSWAESMLCTQLLRAVEKAGYKTPSPIQMATIPLGLQQRDVIGIAETGSGKTAAFLLPLLSYVSKLPPITVDSEADGPYALVMAPTRELALQIQDETVKFARYLGGIRVVSIVGGQSIQEQAFKLRQGCEVVIATPGRLIDCLERRYVVLNQCNYVVLDEADRMIDMGFEPQVVRVLDAMPCSNLKPENEDEELDEKRFYRTTHMSTATMPPAVERLACKYLRNPVVITIGTAGKTSDLITQHVIVVQESEKMPRLQKMLNRLGEKSAIVFVNNRRSADTLSKALDKAGYRVTTLHGGKSQNQREISLEGFRSKRFTLLVATDVMGRGIDIPEVAHVINYDMPGSIETYTHRIGRTGRAGKMGVATTFLTLHDTQVFYDLKQMLIQSNNPMPPELARHEMSKFKPCHFA